VNEKKWRWRKLTTVTMIVAQLIYYLHTYVHHSVHACSLCLLMRDARIASSISKRLQGPDRGQDVDVAWRGGIIAFFQPKSCDKLLCQVTACPLRIMDRLIFWLLFLLHLGFLPSTPPSRQFFHAVGWACFGGEKGERKEKEKSSLVWSSCIILRKRCKESPPFFSNGDYMI